MDDKFDTDNDIISFVKNLFLKDRIASSVSRNKEQSVLLS